MLKSHTISSVVQVCDRSATSDEEDDDYEDNDKYNSTNTRPIHVTIVFGGLTFHHQVAPESSVRSLKQSLMDERHVCLPLVEYELVMRNDVALAGEDWLVLEDEAMALRFYGIRDGAVLHVERKHLGIIVQNQKGQEVWVMVPKMATVGELKHTIMEAARLQCAGTFSLFTTVQVETRSRNDVINFKKLAEEDGVIVSHVLRDRDKLFMIENKFGESPRNLIQESGLRVYGMEVGDTVLSVKLRAQEQLGVSAAHLQVERVLSCYPRRPPALCPEHHRLKPTALYRVIYRFTSATHDLHFPSYLKELAKILSDSASNLPPKNRASRKQERHIFSRGTPGCSAGMNVRTPRTIIEMSPSFQSTYQALSSDTGPWKGTRSNDTVTGEFTNIPTVSGIQAVQNLFGGSSLGTPVFSGKGSSTGQLPIFISRGRHRDQKRRISKKPDRGDSTHPGPQNSTKPNIPQRIGDTKPDTTPNIAEDKPESTPHIEKHTSEQLSITEDKSELSKAEEDKQKTPYTEEYKAESPNSKDDKTEPSNIEKDKPKPASIDESSPNIREDKLESPPSTEETQPEDLLNTGETKEHNTEENKQNTEQDKVNSITNYKANTDRAKTENPPSNGETEAETSSNTEEDKPGPLSISREGQIMSHLSTGETELEAQPNTDKDNPELPIAAENSPEFPTKIQQYISEALPNTGEDLYKPELSNIKGDKPDVPNTREDKPEPTDIEEDKPGLPNIEEDTLEALNNEEDKPETPASTEEVKP